jgi:endoglucanase
MVKRRVFSLRTVVVLGVCLLFSSLSFGAKPAMHGKLQCKVISGKGYICDQNGNPVQMRGMSMYGWANAGGYSFYTPQCIANLYSTWRCHIIRIPYMANGAISQTIYNAVVQACVDSGMYAIIDWHEGAGSSVTAANAFFQTMATKWHTVPNVLYEPWNEPSGIQWTGGIKPYMETIIKTIRAIDPDNIIICGNPNWDQQPQNAAADPITDATNIAYSMHFYSGSHPVGSYSPGITTTMGKGLPVFITEYGACNTGTTLATAACTAWYTYLDQNQIGSTCWAVEYLDACLSIFTKSASNTGPWPDNVISTYGAFIKAYILKGTDTPIGTGVVPYESEPQQRASAPVVKVLSTGADNNSAVYTINGVRCSAAGTLPHGVYMKQAPGHAIVKCVNVVR